MGVTKRVSSTLVGSVPVTQVSGPGPPNETLSGVRPNYDYLIIDHQVTNQQRLRLLGNMHLNRWFKVYQTSGLGSVTPTREVLVQYKLQAVEQVGLREIERE